MTEHMGREIPFRRRRADLEADVSEPRIVTTAPNAQRHRIGAAFASALQRLHQR